MFQNLVYCNCDKHLIYVVLFFFCWFFCMHMPIMPSHKILLASLVFIAVWQSLVCTLGGGRVVLRCRILRHQGVKLILAYSWARPAILVAGKGRGGMLLFLLFLHFNSCFSFFPVPLFHLFYYLFYLFSPFLWEMTQNDPQGLTCR